MVTDEVFSYFSFSIFFTPKKSLVFEIIFKIPENFDQKNKNYSRN